MQTTIHKINKQQAFTKKYIQYLIITFNGKEVEYIYIHRQIYKTESLHYTPETNMTW